MTPLKIMSSLVVSSELLAEEIYKIVLYYKGGFKDAKAGQFVNLYTGKEAMLLPRPISICESDDDTLTLVFKVLGHGTKFFSTLKEGDRINVSSPLGNTFPIENIKKGQSVVLVGGGVGIPPMLNIAKSLFGKGIDVKAVLGFRDEPFLIDEFKKYGCETFVCTDTGSCGFHGNTVQFLKENHIKADFFFSCGPKIMLKFLTDYTMENHMTSYVSMEERMGCGYGACVGCAIDLKDENGETVRKKVCKDGPIFKAEEVIF